MRLRIALPVALALAAPALSQRAVRYFDVEELPVILDTPRLAFCEEGWITRLPRRSGDLLVWTNLRRSQHDSEPDERVRTLVPGDGNPIDAWWAPDGPGQLAWTRGGRLYIGSLPEQGEVAGTDAGPSPDGNVAWPAAGTAAAWCADGKLHVFDGGATRTFPPRAGRRFTGSPSFVNGAAQIAIVTADAANPQSPGDTVEALVRETAAWSVLATEENLSVRELVSAPPRPAAFPAGEAPCRKLAWIASMPGGARVRLHDGATGKTETILDQHFPESIAFTPDSKGIVTLVRSPGKHPVARLVSTVRSGTLQNFADDVIDDGKAGELSRPVANSRGIWFLRKVGGGWKAVRAGEK